LANYTTRRLAITIALFLEHFGEWPTEIRLSSDSLYWTVLGLTQDEFSELATRFKIRVTKHADIAVGSTRGRQLYTQDVHPSGETVDAVEQELRMVLPKPGG
jgi:hypothetical protein